MRDLLLLLAVASVGCTAANGSADSDDGSASNADSDGGAPSNGAETPSDGGTAASNDAAGSQPGPGAAATFNVFDQIPQFGIYTSTDPSYTPPSGVLMWSYGTVFVTKLSPAQQSQIGSDLAARVTYFAQCDNYDRLGALFFLVEPKGQTPKPTDARTEIVRFITPFSDYKRGALATHAYPNADISTYAQTLADPSHDVWIGIAGGSNPYNGDPCTNAGVSAEFAAVGFKYSVDFVSTQALGSGSSMTLTAIGDVQATTIPVSGTFTNPSGSVSGHVTVIVSGHGSAGGGDEYRYTQDTVSVNGQQIGSFSTQIDCAQFAKYSPDGNPGIFQGNLTNNPRNWCPGALVPSHTFAATLAAGTNTVSLGISPSQVPSGSYYATSISFSAP